MEKQSFLVLSGVLVGLWAIALFTEAPTTATTDTTTTIEGSDFRAIAEAVAAPHPEVTPELILAIGDRESHLGALLDANGMGDNGNGCGWMQIDINYHPDFVASVDCATDHHKIADYAINQVYLPYLEQLNGNQRHALAAYNAGVTSVKTALKNGHDPDSVTTGNNYGRDIELNRIDKFR